MGGNAGIVTVIVAATSSMVTSQGYQLPINVLILIIGILLIYKLAKFRGFTKKWEHFIEKKLMHHYEAPFFNGLLMVDSNPR